MSVLEYERYKPHLYAEKKEEKNCKDNKIMSRPFGRKVYALPMIEVASGVVSQNNWAVASILEDEDCGNSFKFSEHNYPKGFPSTLRSYEAWVDHKRRWSISISDLSCETVL